MLFDGSDFAQGIREKASDSDQSDYDRHGVFNSERVVRQGKDSMEYQIICGRPPCQATNKVQPKLMEPPGAQLLFFYDEFVFFVDQNGHSSTAVEDAETCGYHNIDDLNHKLLNVSPVSLF